MAVYPYSPGLNPVEKLWQYIKDHTIKNRIYETIKELEDSDDPFYVAYITVGRYKVNKEEGLQKYASSAMINSFKQYVNNANIILLK